MPVVKAMGLKRKERIDLALQFLEMVRVRMSGNIFCEDNRNIVWSEGRVMELMSNTKWISADKKGIRVLFQTLHAGLLSLNEAIFRNANNVAREVHGPYRVRYKGRPMQLLVREYYDLEAPGLEPGMRNFPYKSVETYVLYDTQVNFYFPVLNDYSHDLPLSDHTLYIFGKVREKGGERALTSKSRLQKVYKEIEKKSNQISMAVESKSRDEQVLESLRRVYYRGKVLRDALNKDWEPPKGLMERVEKDLSTFPNPKRRNMTKKQFYTRMDPRID